MYSTTTECKRWEVCKNSGSLGTSAAVQAFMEIRNACNIFHMWKFGYGESIPEHQYKVLHNEHK